MIDLHVHLLPGVDDGPRTLEESRRLLERAKEVGYRTLVATPHLGGRLDPATRDRVATEFHRIREVAADLGLAVVLGYEVMLQPDLPDRLANGEPIGIGGGDAILVEAPFVGWPAFADGTLFALRVAGYRPVLAHPERYETLRKDHKRLEELAERGIVLQITIGSLVGLFGRDAAKTAERAIVDGVAHLVATDAHSAGSRFSSVPSGLRRLRSLVGEERFQQLVDEAPRALLTGAPLPEPAPIRRRSWFSGLVSPLRVGPGGNP